jgi:sulfane dehydrogenase subunit SoxC
MKTALLSMTLIIIVSLVTEGCIAQPTTQNTISTSADITDKTTQLSTIASNHVLVDGLVATSLDLSYEGVLRYPTKTKTAILFCAGVYENQPSRDWLGVPVELILKDAGVLPGATKLIFHATDGYTVIQSIDRIILFDAILAYKVDGEILLPQDGYPFRLISDKLAGGDWIMGVNHIEVA